MTQQTLSLLVPMYNEEKAIPQFFSAIKAALTEIDISWEIICVNDGSKDRTAELGELRVPSLIIHGDEDPLIPMSGGEATAAAIPDAKLMIVKGMGHVLPNLNAYWSDIKDAMINHMGKV